jgi:hypothetical protein
MAMAQAVRTAAQTSTDTRGRLRGPLANAHDSPSRARVLGRCVTALPTPLDVFGRLGPGGGGPTRARPPLFLARTRAHAQ